jgi:hypothetical protein
MSALVDTPSKEELKRREMKKAERSLKMASGSSDDDHHSATERSSPSKGKLSSS